MGSTQILSARNPVCKDKLETCQLKKLYRQIFRIHASSNGGEIISGFKQNANAFYKTIKLSYSGHFPLTLAPDDVWLAIAKGVSLNINYNAKKLRAKFVQHEGKKDITILGDQFCLHPHNKEMKQIMDYDFPPLSWSGCVDALVNDVERKTYQNISKIFTCDFSTTTLHIVVNM